MNKDFEAVVGEIRDAIIDRNFKITRENEISKGMTERGADMFSYKIIEFCSREHVRHRALPCVVH